MSLMLFNTCLPALLGYALFVGISGRLNPLVRPAELPDRPTWFIGLWAGGCVALVLGLGLSIAFNLEPIPGETAAARFSEQVAGPGAGLLFLLLTPGAVMFIGYRTFVRRSLESPRLQRLDADPAVADFRESCEDTALDKPTADTSIVATFLETPRLEHVDPPSQPVATDDDCGESPSTAGDPSAAGDVEPTEESAVARSRPSDLRTCEVTIEAASVTRRVTRTDAFLTDTERHLKVTRRALYLAEREIRSRRAEHHRVLSSMERNLESRAHHLHKARTRAAAAREARQAAERRLVALNAQTSGLREALRESATSRARAICNAQKALSLAHRSIRIRRQLNRELGATRETLANSQDTIRSLIDALEAEKTRSEADLLEQVEARFLREKQLRTRRAINAVSRNVENRLKSRLVRKVARARPLEHESLDAQATDAAPRDTLEHRASDKP